MLDSRKQKSGMSFSLSAAGASWKAELKPIPPYFTGSFACSHEVSTILTFEIESRLNREISSYFSRRTGCLKHGDVREMKRSLGIENALLRSDSA